MLKNKTILFLIIIQLFLINYNVVSKDKIDQKKLEMMIGQMIMAGFRGFDVSEKDYIVKDIKDRNLGGIVIFDYDVVLKSPERNVKSPEQVKALLEKLSSFAKTPLFIAVDQEGGKVARLKAKFGFPASVSAKSLGDKNDLLFTENEAEKIGATLYEMGININFAPVVDLNINPENPAIGKYERSFSADSSIVINHAEAFIKGLGKNRILACLKHFPGHGSAWNDSHYGMADVSDTWIEEELLPYKELIKKDVVDIIMTAHIFNKKLDPDYPATLSKKILTDLLRKGLGFDGVIISDDMQMGAISGYYGLKKSIILALDGGIDILLFCNNNDYDEKITEKIIRIIKSLVMSNKISFERIEESYNRIMKLKDRIGK